MKKKAPMPTPLSTDHQWQQPRCVICGRFMRHVIDAYTAQVRGWRCPKVWYAGEGQWEHE
jgi:hypothetical protein